MIKRINLLGAPSSGKTTVASVVFAHLKERGFEVELVPEYIKSWVYEQKFPQGYDELYVFAKQIHAEDVYLRGGAKLIVTDASPLLVCFYMWYGGHPYWRDLMNVYTYYNELNPSLNILLTAEGLAFQETGRYHGLEECKRIHEQLKIFLTISNVKSYETFAPVDLGAIIGCVDTNTPSTEAVCSHSTPTVE
jgi:nicotinamide riboside kinase